MHLLLSFSNFWIRRIIYHLHPPPVCPTVQPSFHPSIAQHGEIIESSIAQQGETTRSSITQHGEINKSSITQHDEITKFSIAEHCVTS